MRTLHTLNKTGKTATLCFRTIANDDALLLIENAVYLLHEQKNLNSVEVPIYAIEEDLLSRGISADCFPEVKLINMTQFVELTEQFTKIISWY